jgi:uncharacterized cupin superfamily protein
MIDHTAAMALSLTHEDVSPEQLVTGAPTTGYQALGEYAGREFGVWEMTPGAMSDVEVEELFIVLSGDATVEFLDDGTSVELFPGFIGRLRSGDRTVWTVRETIRKVYLS